MRRSISTYLFRLIASAVCALAPTHAYSQSPPPPDVDRDPLNLQPKRNRQVDERGRTVSYTNQWDLGSLPKYLPEQQVSGRLRIWGLDYMRRSGLSTVWAEGFRKYHPGVTIEYNLPTALIGIPGLVSGTADLAASRAITLDEIQLFQRVFSCDPVEIEMVTGSLNVPGWATALAIVVNKANPISKLTLRQLDGIFGAERTGANQGLAWHPELARGPEENIRTWGQLGLSGEWKDKPINVYSAALQGDYHYPRVFEKIVFKGGNKWNEKLREYHSYLDSKGSWVSHAEQIITELTKDPYGIAVTWMVYLNPQTKILPIAIKESGPYAEMTIENVQNRTYPLILREYWYFYRKPGERVEPKVKEFVTYAISREGQEAVVRDGKFLPLTAAVVREQLKKLE
jgi:phosphate transport system substrate-binding protein